MSEGRQMFARRIEFSVQRFYAILAKEFIQMRRDRVTFVMMVGIPLLQLILFGFAINSDPKGLPTAVYTQDYSSFSRALVAGVRNTGYFKLTHEVNSEADIKHLLQIGAIQFAIHIPREFSRKVVRGEHPVVLLEADATDPAALGYALSAVNSLSQTVLREELKGVLRQSDNTPSNSAPSNSALSNIAGGGVESAVEAGAPLPVVEFLTHRHYNPEVITQYNIVPGLLGVVLTMTLVIITALAITRERERGTMENLLSTPAHAAEVMIGKIVPYIIVGFIQASLILLAAKFIFDVPIVGSIPLLYCCVLVFIVANLGVGITFSTIAANQLQAVQMSFFFFLPSLLLSGFMFPFRGMPQWAQNISEVLPLTHFLRIVRGIILKGSDVSDVLPELWPILVFAVVVLSLAIGRFRQTLD